MTALEGLEDRSTPSRRANEASVNAATRERRTKVPLLREARAFGKLLAWEVIGCRLLGVKRDQLRQSRHRERWFG